MTRKWLILQFFIKDTEISKKGSCITKGMVCSYLEDTIHLEMKQLRRKKLSIPIK